jgi:cytochrome c nitrite reductase small subunit
MPTMFTIVRGVGIAGGGALLLAVLGGMLAGMGAFTFTYGEGMSYFSEDPRACINCHVMQDQYDSWVKSSHSAFATCNDCHLPNEAPASYIAKADNGFFHSWAFTFDDFHEPIQIKPRNYRIVQNNCIDCHSTMVHELVRETVRGESVSCIHCHTNVGHAASR